ncbi:MAG TPA: T9SS type A sorting domain-containing protein [Bacteroidales bacterium]|nr:T9SS type A sorting domain-containing protein [Bacteroidales bacterium]
MKRLILLFSSLLLLPVTYSQIIVDTNKLWVDAEYINFGPGFTTAYRFQDDTIIGAYEYKELYKTDDISLTDWGLRGWMREEDKIVYFKDPYWDDDEYILYDFNLEMGDTFNFIKYPWPMIVESIDTVILLNGELKKRIILDCFGDSEEWIEGIGSTRGLTKVTEGIDVSDLWYWLNCFFENDILKYEQFFLIYDCFFNTTGIDKNTLDQKIVVSPNPFSDYTTFKYELPESGVIHLTIVNHLGQEVGVLIHETQPAGKHQVQWNVKGLSEGVYFYHLTMNKQQTVNGKLILVR